MRPVPVREPRRFAAARRRSVEQHAGRPGPDVCRPLTLMETVTQEINRGAKRRTGTDAAAALISDFLGTDPRNTPHPLRPIAALSEVIAICRSVEGGRDAPQPRDRRSLIADVQESLTSLGQELKRNLQPSLYDYFHGELAQVDVLFSEPPGVARLKSATVAVLEQLRAPRAASAAWRDLVSAVRTGSSEEESRLRALQLREIDESLGHEWRWRGRRLCELVREESLEDAEAELSIPPRESAEVAWFVFADADLPDTYLRIGQVQFFSHRLWPEAVTSREFFANRPESEFPAELDEHALRLLEPSEGAEAYVYARVELRGPRATGERNPWAHARPPKAWARELVLGIVDAGTFRVGGTTWKLLSDVTVYHGTISDDSGEYGNWSFGVGYDDLDLREFDRRARSPIREGTGEALSELNPRFAELLSEGDSAAHDSLATVRWYEAARSQQDSAQRVVLYVRVFERVLPTSETLRWSDACKRFLREFWSLEEFDNTIFRLAHAADFELRHLRREELGGLEQWLVSGGEHFSINLGTFMRTAANIGPLLPSTSRLTRRGVRQVAKWAANPIGTREELARVEQRFDALLARALRQRNSVVHGLETVPEVVSSVEPFVARLGGFVVAQAVHGAAIGEDPVEALERGRVRSRRILWRLDQGEQPVERVLYSAENC